MLIPGHNTAEQFAEIERTLEMEYVPLVVRTLCWWISRASDDPLIRYLTQHYVRVSLAHDNTGISTFTLFRRRMDPPHAASKARPPL